MIHYIHPLHALHPQHTLAYTYTNIYSSVAYTSERPLPVYAISTTNT